MAQFKLHKYVSTLPGVLENGVIYFVRTGSGFDIYVTNQTGTPVAYPLNLPTGGGGSSVGVVPVRGGFDATQRFIPPESFNIGSGTSNLAAGRLMMLRFTGRMGAKGLCTEIATATTSGKVRIGIYGSNAKGLPTGSPLFDSGDIDSSVIGQKIALFPSTIQLDGVYWLAVFVSVATTFRAINAAGAYTFPQWSTSNAGQAVLSQDTSTPYGPLPANPWQSWVSGVTAPLVCVIGD